MQDEYYIQELPEVKFITGDEHNVIPMVCVNIGIGDEPEYLQWDIFFDMPTGKWWGWVRVDMGNALLFSGVNEPPVRRVRMVSSGGDYIPMIPEKLKFDRSFELLVGLFNADASLPLFHIPIGQTSCAQ